MVFKKFALPSFLAVVPFWVLFSWVPSFHCQIQRRWPFFLSRGAGVFLLLIFFVRCLEENFLLITWAEWELGLIWEEFSVN